MVFDLAEYYKCSNNFQPVLYARVLIIKNIILVKLGVHFKKFYVCAFIYLYIFCSLLGILKLLSDGQNLDVFTREERNFFQKFPFVSWELEQSFFFIYYKTIFITDI